MNLGGIEDNKVINDCFDILLSELDKPQVKM